VTVLSEQVKEQLRQRFGERLQEAVELRLYTKPGSGRLILPSGMGCPTCEDARLLAEDVRDTAPDKLSLEVVNVDATVEDVPTLTVGPPGEEHRIRFMGLTAGYEFATVVDAIERTSRDEAGLSEKTLGRLQALGETLEVMVFATPT
jgi:alkyl hydroperoxide reductase subunit AhpF